MKSLEVGLIYEPPEQDPLCHVRRKVLELGETTIGSQYVRFLDLIEYRGTGCVSREEFERWMTGQDLSRSWDGDDD